MIPAWEIDCGYSPYCIYNGNTFIFYVVNATWINQHHYYILFSSGVLTGNVFCAPESAPITGIEFAFFLNRVLIYDLDPTFWTFDIWNPLLSSTTPSTTTPPTTGTITTRVCSDFDNILIFYFL